MKNPFYTLIPNFISEDQINRLITEAAQVRANFYNEKNLISHRAYVADEQPNRSSHAYAFGSREYTELGHIPSIVDAQVAHHAPMTALLGKRVMVDMLGIAPDARVLFNVQEYRAAADPVPRHCDGELLDFDVLPGGKLDIRRAIRPERVAVLTLVNDSQGGGTRLHFSDGTEEVIVGKPGDLLVFDNIQTMHSVDRLEGEVKRSDGLLRMTVGWRSLNDKTWHYHRSNGLQAISRRTADEMTLLWHAEQWPMMYARIKNQQQKAAF